MPFCDTVLECLALDSFDLSPVFLQEGHKCVQRYMGDEISGSADILSLFEHSGAGYALGIITTGIAVSFSWVTTPIWGNSCALGLPVSVSQRTSQLVSGSRKRMVDNVSRDLMRTLQTMDILTLDGHHDSEGTDTLSGRTSGAYLLLSGTNDKREIPAHNKPCNCQRLVNNFTPCRFKLWLPNPQLQTDWKANHQHADPAQ